MMQHLMTVAKTLVVKDDGQDLVEYGLLAALIALAAMTSVSTLGSTIRTVFWDVIASGL
jgi:pilus assembly protein Flp/PilA